MEEQEHIGKGLLAYMKLMVLLFMLPQSVVALLNSPEQADWETCRFESLDFDLSLCNQGSVRNTHPYSCSPKKPCCPCPSGTFMDMYNNCSVCKPLRDCDAEGKQVLVQGSATQDTVCGDDILVTTETWTTVPVISTLPTAIKSTSADIQPNQTKPHLNINTTCNPPGDDEGGGGTSVIRFDGGSAVLILLCTLLVICHLVILLFIRYPNIPQRLHALLSKKKPQGNFHAIPMKDLEAGSEPADV